MKKIIAVILALTMCLSLLAACGGDTTSETTIPPDSADAITSTDSTEPESAAPGTNEETPGQVWMLLPTVTSPGLVMISEGMGEVMAGQGYTYELKDCQGDDATYVSYIENAITAGDVDVLMVAAQSVAAVKDACQDAINAGIIVIMLGADPTAETSYNTDPYEIDALIITSYALTGYYAEKAMEEWILQNEDNLQKSDNGKVPVAVTTYYDIEDGAKRSAAFLGELEKSDLAYAYTEKSIYGDDAQTLAYSWAETVLTANPDVRIFLCYEYGSGYGVINYLQQYADENGYDLKDFCVIFCYEDAETPALLEQAVEDPSSTALKGYVTYGAAPAITGETLGKLALGRIDGTYEFGYKYIDIIHAHTNFGYDEVWEDGQENPAEEYESLG